MSKHNEVLLIEQLRKQCRSARAIFPLTKSKSSSLILDIFKVFLASKYVEKLMEMTFMFKNTRGSYTWYPSNTEVMLLPRHQRVDVSSSKKREYLRKFRMDLLEGTSVTIALTIWRRKAFQKRGGEKDTCTNTIGKEIWKITITNLNAVSMTSRTFYD